jgi:hypothetical protein
LAVPDAAESVHMRTPDRAASHDYSRGPEPLQGAEIPAAEPLRRDPEAVSKPALGRSPRARRWPGQLASDSRGQRRARALCALLGLAGALALVVADFTTLHRVIALGGATEITVGHAQHGYALALLGATAVLLLGFALRGSQAAAVAVTVLGLAALIVGPISDRNVVGSTGLLGRLYETVASQSGPGYRLELVGSVALLLAGAGLIAAAPPQLRGQLARVKRRRLGGDGGDS